MGARRRKGAKGRRHHSESRPSGLEWPQLPSPEGVSLWVCMWNAAPVAALPRNPRPAKAASVPPICLQLSCHHERAIRQLDVGIPNRRSSKMAQCSSWTCPTRSFAPIISSKSEIPLSDPCCLQRSHRACLRFGTSLNLVSNPLNSKHSHLL